MAQSYKFLRASTVVFKVLAWVSLVLQVVTGVILLVVGGEPVAIGGIGVPARVVGVLNFVVAGMYFFSLWLMANLIRLWLDIRDRLPGS
ncbi:MAG: hypothetical protein HY596_01125 [Candidatus Omnitrophica bacterium]|nr:hypothetical protein [Candidatus Omnitrophota bacterium]